MNCMEHRRRFRRTRRADVGITVRSIVSKQADFLFKKTKLNTMAKRKKLKGYSFVQTGIQLRELKS